MRPDLIKQARKLQDEVLDYCTGPLELSKTDIARILGVSRQQVTSWTCDGDSWRPMPVIALLHLARLRRDPIGALRPLHDELGLVAVRTPEGETQASGQLSEELMVASAVLGRLHGAAAAAMADGVIDSQERAELAPAARDLLRQAQQLVASLETGPRSVRAS